MMLTDAFTTPLQDTDELAQHLRDTPGYIEELYEAMSPLSAATYSDEPSQGMSSGSKPPLSLTLLELIDYEAKWIGMLSASAMTTGGLPYKSYRCFYTNAGDIAGISTRPGSLDRFRQLCNHMAVYASTLYDCDESSTYLLGMWRTRQMTSKIINSSSDEWLTLEQAARFTGKAEGTIKQWAKSGALQVIDSKDLLVDGASSERLFSKRSLDLYLRALDFKNKNRKHQGSVDLSLF